jgi:DNA polymerase IV (DinB-like DNA polymerase)
MLVDLDYFYAQCEETRNPSIRGKAVVVSVYSGRTEDSGVVSTANYLAREYGVRSGIPISVAKNRLRDADAVFLPVDHSFYGEVSEKVMTVLRGYADRFERVGIDEAYLDVTERARGDFATAAEIARSTKKEIHSQLGLTCSIGIGPNRLVAKIAADANKPDGLTVVEPGALQEFRSLVESSGYFAFLGFFRHLSLEPLTRIEDDNIVLMQKLRKNWHRAMR